MKKHQPKFSHGSLYICSKCGQTFDQPDGQIAEKLKTDLRSELKNMNKHTQVRVMVGSCVSVCENNQQTFTYYPNQGEIEIYTESGSHYENLKKTIIYFIKTK